MTLRRPSSALNEQGSSRMPFAAAEALLWGPELRKQHGWLLGEMRALKAQHENYSTRIQTAEAAAEAAEAATSRIRHLEHQIAAMEAVDDEKSFEKWVSVELNELKMFVDKNKTVRQKQIELDKEVSDIVDDLGKLKDISTDFRSLRRQIALLEASRKHDTNQIKSLEKEILRLKSIVQGSIISDNKSGVAINSKQSLSKLTKSLLVHETNDLDETTETEDEVTLPPRNPSMEQIQVPRSPEIKQKYVSRSVCCSTMD